METVIFAGLLFSGYLANQSNDDNINKNKQKKIKKDKQKIQKIIQKQIKEEKNKIKEEINNKNQQEINNEIQQEINNEIQEELNNELNNDYNNHIDEPIEYNQTTPIFNISELDDDISGRNKIPKNYKKINSKLTGDSIEFSHNNMQPFFGSSVKQNTDLNKTARELDIFTGGEDLKKPKKEVEGLFEPEKQNIFGMQNYAEQYKNNINQSRYENHNLPFEQLKVGPGVGLDYDDGPTGGFQQDIRKYELPKTVDDLRAKNNPRVTYKGRIIKGKKEIKRDSGYYFTKNKHAIMAVDKAQFPNSGVAKETKRSDIYIKNNNRKISKEVMGPAGSITSKEYKKQNFRPSDKLKLDVDTTRNITGDTKYDFDKGTFYCPETKREEQANAQFTKKLYVANLLKALIPTAQYDDTARKTIRETTEENKALLNLKGGEKIKMYNKQPARTTIRETTENNVKDILNIKLYNKLPERVKQKIKTTLKETLLDNNHSGYITVENKKTTVRNLDKLKTTLKETLLRDSELLNMIAGYKGTKQFDDIAKLTHKETYTHNYSVGGAAENRNDGYKTANMEMVETNREKTCDHEYVGIGDRENATGYMTNEYESKETNK